jgi:predicted translin family RNA/ssDNA-binding protein
MLESAFKEQLYQEFQAHQDQRHQLIRQSNDALRKSKQAIFHLHRKNIKEAQTNLQEVQTAIKKIEAGILQIHTSLRYQGAYLAALEEYVEAYFFAAALANEPLKVIADVSIPVEQYIGGLADLTGELTRQAVLQASDKQFDEVKRYAAIVEGIVGALLQFDLTGHLRQKYDDAKRNLKRIESIQYDISLRD